MLTKPSLYDQSPAAWDKIAKSTGPHLAQMARQFALCADMDRALGYNSGATSHWHSGRNRPSAQSDRIAEIWLRDNAPHPVPATVDDTLLLVVCPTPEIAAKARRLLAVIGCEVESV